MSKKAMNGYMTIETRTIKIPTIHILTKILRYHILKSKKLGKKRFVGHVNICNPFFYAKL